MVDVVVVGAGIMGATISEVLRSSGLEVLNLDDRRPMSGTVPSGGHLKPSWFGGLPRKEYEPAMELLDQTWGLITERFILRPTPLHTTVYRVDTDRVTLDYRGAEFGTVNSIQRTDRGWITGWMNVTRTYQESESSAVVVATGAWADQLVSGLSLTLKQGVSFRITGQLRRPFIKPWAPYKQVVAHQQGELEVWAGDGTAILPTNWSDVRREQCLTRCRKAADLEGRALYREGLRAYVPLRKKEPCRLEEFGPRAWVATGAGKSGTIAAGWAAHRLRTALTS